MKKLLNYKNTIKFAGLMALIAMALMFTSCGGNEPEPQPGPNPNPNPNQNPTPVTVDTTKYTINNVEYLKNHIAGMTQIAGAENKLGIIDFELGTKLAVNDSEIGGLLAKFLNVLEKNNIELGANGAVIIPSEKNIKLDDTMCDVLVKLWNLGIKFFVDENAVRFYVTAVQLSKFTPEMRQFLFNLDAEIIVVTNQNEFESMTKEAIKLANEGRAMNLELDIPELSLDLDNDLKKQEGADILGTALKTPNLTIIPNKTKVTINATENFTNPSVVSQFYNWDGIPMKLIIANKGLVMLNDSVANMIRTKETDPKLIYNMDIMKQINGKLELTDPRCATYFDWENKDITYNNEKLISTTFKRLYPGIYTAEYGNQRVSPKGKDGFENGSLAMLRASYLLTNGAKSVNDLPDGYTIFTLYIPYIKYKDNKIIIRYSNDPRYIDEIYHYESDHNVYFKPYLLVDYDDILNQTNRAFGHLYAHGNDDVEANSARDHWIFIDNDGQDLGLCAELPITRSPLVDDIRNFDDGLRSHLIFSRYDMLDWNTKNHIGAGQKRYIPNKDAIFQRLSERQY